MIIFSHMLLSSTEAINSMDEASDTSASVSKSG
jgi:hypothetical protein